MTSTRYSHRYEFEVVKDTDNTCLVVEVSYVTQNGVEGPPERRVVARGMARGWAQAIETLLRVHYSTP